MVRFQLLSIGITVRRLGRRIGGAVGLRVFVMLALSPTCTMDPWPTCTYGTHRPARSGPRDTGLQRRVRVDPVPLPGGAHDTPVGAELADGASSVRVPKATTERARRMEIK